MKPSQILITILFSLLAAVVVTLAQNGAFEPDNVIRVDTLRTTRVDTVFLEPGELRPTGCNLEIVFGSGRKVRATHVKEHLGRWLSAGTLDHVLVAWRDCAGRTHRLEHRVRATVFDLTER